MESHKIPWFQTTNQLWFFPLVAIIYHGLFLVDQVIKSLIINCLVDRDFLVMDCDIPHEIYWFSYYPLSSIIISNITDIH